MKHLQKINEFFGLGNPKFIIGNTYIHRPKTEKPYRMIYQGKTKDNTQEIFKREDNGQLLYFFPHYIKGDVFNDSKNLEPWYKNENKLNEGEHTEDSEIIWFKAIEEIGFESVRDFASETINKDFSDYEEPDLWNYLDYQGRFDEFCGYLSRKFNLSEKHKLNEETNYSDILKSIEGSNMFPKELTDKYKIVKEKYPDWKHKDAQERAKKRKKELENDGFKVKLRKWNFEDLGRGYSWSITAIKEK